MGHQCYLALNHKLDEIVRTYEKENIEYEHDGGLSIFNHPGQGLGAQIVHTNTEKRKLDEAHIYV